MDVDFTLQDLPAVAADLILETGRKKVIAFHGEMGAGKTTFIHALCSSIGVEQLVSSPTFSIINEYSAADGSPVYHMDLYRLKSNAEAIAAGVEDCLYSGELCLVEWPENAAGLMPPGTIHCYLKSVGDIKRNLQIIL